MIIVSVAGGLGNQMFQYAYAKLLLKSGKSVKLCLSNFQTKIENRLSSNDSKSTFYNQNFHIHKYFLDELFDVDVEYATTDESNKYDPKF